MYDADGRASLVPFSMDDYRKVAAHEFGHAAYHIKDLYGNSKYKDIKSIMKTYRIGTQPIDFELMISSFWFKNTNIYSGSSTADIIDKYLQ